MLYWIYEISLPFNSMIDFLYCSRSFFPLLLTIPALFCLVFLIEGLGNPLYTIKFNELYFFWSIMVYLRLLIYTV